MCDILYTVQYSQGLQRDVVYLCWPIAPQYTSPNAGEWGGGGWRVAGSQPMSTAVHITWHGAQINFGDLTPYLTYMCTVIYEVQDILELLQYWRKFVEKINSHDSDILFLIFVRYVWQPQHGENTLILVDITCCAGLVVARKYGRPYLERKKTERGPIFFFAVVLFVSDSPYELSQHIPIYSFSLGLSSTVCVLHVRTASLQMKGPVRIRYKCLVTVYVFPERQLCNVQPPYFQNWIIIFCLTIPTLIYLWEIYIFPGSVCCLLCCLQICGPILGIYESLTDTWMWKLRLRPRNSQKRNT